MSEERIKKALEELNSMTNEKIVDICNIGLSAFYGNMIEYMKKYPDSRKW